MAPRDELLRSAQAFCNAFSEKQDVEILLAYFSTTHQVSAIEHGLPVLAPFLGKRFTGISGIRQYFELIGSLLSYNNISFSEYLVDSETMKVSVKGVATFTWLNTGQSWDEVFTYTLDFDDELKLVQYQVWADSGAAFLAAQGKLRPESEVCIFPSLCVSSVNSLINTASYNDLNAVFQRLWNDSPVK